MSTTPGPTRLLSDRERELGAIIAAYNDVTERLKDSHERLQSEAQRLREELAKTNRELARRERLAALGSMAAGLAHEIRNPLGGIQLFAGLLARDVADRPDQLRLVQRITSGVQSLERIVTDILAFAGPAEPRFETVAVGRVVEDVMELARATFDDQGATLACAGSPGGVFHADPCQVQQALLNLLRNAAEAAGAGGCVTFTVDADGEQVCFVVEDDGEGIPPDRLDRVFNPFYTTKDHGTGLGLAIVHRIAEAHGGHIRAANREAGGAVFTLSLPRWQATRSADVPEEQVWRACAS